MKAGLCVATIAFGMLAISLSGCHVDDSHALSLEQVNTTSTQTLSNKTLVSPVISGTLTGSPTITSPTFTGTVSGTYLVTGSPIWNTNFTMLSGKTLQAGSNLLIGSPLADKLNAQHLAITGQTTGDLLVAATSSSFTRLSGAIDGYVLRSTGSASSPFWGKVRISGATTDIAGILPPVNGGTGNTAVPSNGQIPIGNGSEYIVTNLTAGSGVSITNGSGSVTISSPYLFTGFSQLGCASDVVSPNTKIVCSASIAILQTPTSQTVRLTTPGSVQCDISLTGPIVNGRDQAGAFGANQWVSLWMIYNGAVTGCITSLQLGPEFGPVLPSGYTHFAYMGAVRADSLGNLKGIAIRGAHVFYRTAESIATISSPGSTSSSTTSAVPPQAIAATFFTRSLLTSNATGKAGTSFQFSYDNSASYAISSYNVETHGASDKDEIVSTFTMPLPFSTIYSAISNYLNPSNVASMTCNINVLSYQVPNGAI